MKKINLSIAFCLFLFTTNLVSAQEAGIPMEEFNSLKELYDNSVGPSWTNNTNWLDTAQYKVADWYGITVENGHVTKIELPGNNLQEEVFSSRINLPELKVLDISGNLLVFANFNSLDSLSKLHTLKIENNSFIFKHIQPVFYLPQYEQLAAGFTYSPQAKIDIPENVESDLNQNCIFSISEYYISPNDQFQWYKDGIQLEGENNSTIEFLPVTKADSGSYWLQITNPGVPDLTLKSHYKTLYVNSPRVAGAGVPLSEYNALADFYNSMNGENWTRNDNWLDTINHTVNDWLGVWVENGHVIEIGFNNNNVKGEIPPSIVYLSYLKKVIFNKCEIKSKISDGLIQIPTLTNVFIRDCKLTDSFNDIISNSQESLQILNLELNNISGTIPDEIGNKYFKQIWITGNNISGQIPSSIGNLTQLFVFYAADNNLTGKIPAEFGNITGIQTVILSNNKIEGPLPTSLQNLVNLEDFVLDNNLIGTQDISGTPSYLKSAVTEVERQIPDELSNLIALNQLKIENNNLMFNDVEAVFSWENFNKINDFTYFPQDSVGINKAIHKTANENITLSISNYHPGPSDQYQWYKNGVKISGENSAHLNLNNLQTDDSGLYHCKITNPVASELTLFSRINSLLVGPAPASAGVPLSEYNALAELYHSTQGENWKVNTNWLDTINCEVKDWTNVQVVDGHVTNLYLDSNNVAGALPDELVNLTYLEGLHLFGNNITGEIPQEIGKLTRLLYFSLSHNNLTGEIPESLFQIKNLYLLHLTHNNMEGNIMAEIANLTNLESLSLDLNNLSGSIPPEIGNLTKLRHLNLSHNAITGVIPAETGNLTELRSLNLSNNFLEGPVPAELNNLTKAYRIDIENNLIGNSEPEEKSGFVKNGLVDNNRQISDELAGLLQMDTLYLGGNKLQFNDIEAIFSWENYSDFEDFIYAPQDSVGTNNVIEKNEYDNVTISINNYYPGPSDQYQWYKNGVKIPGEKSAQLNLNNLQTDDSGLYHCKITNPVASELTLFSRINSLAVEPAPASAGIPLSEYKALAELYHSTQGPNWKVNTNWLDTINCEVKDWANVQVVNGHVTNLYLDSNNVAGVLPDELVNLTYLEGLHLFGNSITGEIPKEIGKLTRLLYFSLSHNNLTGEIPESIFQIKNLYLLHLTHNNMEGNIPAEIANLTNLESLNLTNNKLSGTIPPEIGNLSKLRHLNLSHNSLTGVIPTETGNLTELRSLILSNNFLEGPVPAELNNLTKAYRIDIENNLIGNNNPEEKSVFAKSGLVDNNRQIPDELAGLLQMDTLYLGGNKLQFNDIEAIFSWNNYSEFEDFIYFPQDSVGWSKTLEGETGHEITIELNNYFPGPSDQYQWYKNGEILEGADSSSLFIENLAEADSGKYVCKITNPVAAELTLYSREIKLAVTKSTGITTVAQNVVSVYPNPAAGRLFLDVQNRAADLEIFNATGNLVRAFPDITNGWIDVNDFRKGIYLFKIKIKGDQTVFKKVIIRN